MENRVISGDTMNIILFGPQGSGKGTLARYITNEYGLCHVSTGDLMRAEVARNTPLGKKLSEIMSKGELVPDEITNKLLIEKSKSKECEKGMILDGYPRNKDQLELVKKQFKIDAAIELDLSDEDSIRRLSSRRQCSKCNSIFNIVTVKPKKEGICDNCGSKLFQRQDDKPEEIKKRLNIYKEQTAPMKKYFSEAKILYKVNGNQTPETVWADAKVILKKLKK